mmetsp:Transcript_15647/g.24336  ORF Transcript_15647/g.24336 Transcript_15647/m.24336 type:complete len:218 (+) Transcript_15647:57-710(+)
MISIQSIASSLHKQLDHVNAVPLENVISFARSRGRKRRTVMTLHLVPIGGILDWNEFGDEELSAIVLACFDADSCTFQTVAAVDYSEDMEPALEELSDYMRPNKDQSYDMGTASSVQTDGQAQSTITCDIWFDPVQVWEVEADLQYLTQSNEFTAAAMKSGVSAQGIGFVSPKPTSSKEKSSSAIKFVRLCCDEWDNTGVEEATTSDAVLHAFVVNQ